MDAAAATPPGAGKGRGRGRGRGRPPKSQATPEKAPGAGGSGSAAGAAVGAGGSADAAAPSPGPGAGAGAAAGASGAGGSAAAAGLGPAGGGVTKKRPGRPAKPKVAADEAPAADDLGRLEELPPPPPPPDTSMPYRNMFTKELERLMYGFGDSERPLPQTVQVVEDILIEYVRGTCCAALNEAGRLGKLERDRASGATKLKIDEKDILFLVRKDPKKYTRIRELLEMQIQIKEMRKALDEQALQKIETEDAPGAGGAGAGGEDGGGEDLGPDVPDDDLDVE